MAIAMTETSKQEREWIDAYADHVAERGSLYSELDRRFREHWRREPSRDEWRALFDSLAALGAFESILFGLRARIDLDDAIAASSGDGGFLLFADGSIERGQRRDKRGRPEEHAVACVDAVDTSNAVAEDVRARLRTIVWSHIVIALLREHRSKLTRERFEQLRTGALLDHVDPSLMDRVDALRDAKTDAR